MQDILDLCCNLVVFDDSLDVFRFCHASVREFLELQPRFSFQNVNIHATQECVKLVLRSFNAPITSQLEFTMYAREFWIEHYIVLNSQSRRTQSIANEVKDFYVRETRAGRISEMFGGKIVFGEDPVVGIPDSIVDRCTHALTEAVEAIFGCEIGDVNLQDFIDTTCRYLAARNLQKAIVKDLPRRDAHANILSMLRGAALVPAAEDRAEKMAMRMMQQGANIITPLDIYESRIFAKDVNRARLERLIISNGVQSEAARKYSQYLVDCVSEASSETWWSDVLGALLVDRITPISETDLSPIDFGSSTKS